MRFGLFFLGEYVHMQVLGALTAVFFAMVDIIIRGGLQAVLTMFG